MDILEKLRIKRCVVSDDFKTIKTDITKIDQEREEAAQEIERLRKQVEAMQSMFKYLDAECLTLECSSSQIADTGDCDIVWRVISYHMSKPNERIEGVGNSPFNAIKDAMTPTPEDI